MGIKAVEITNLLETVTESKISEKDNGAARRHANQQISKLKSEREALRKKIAKASEKRDAAPNSDYDRLNKPVQKMWDELGKLNDKIAAIHKEKKKAFNAMKKG